MAKPKSNPVYNPVVDRIEDLLSQQHKTKQALIQYIGLANGTFTSWRYKGGQSYLLHIDKIAKFLNVTPNYLLKGIDEQVNMDTLSALEIELITLYRKMDNDRKETLMEVAHHFAGR